ncbi:MAG: hypothetical protein FJX62_09115 [Alphaproteobacteria bacterium]|nr:hypothetical protein [Alphaproteobacteria bacterium]
MHCGPKRRGGLPGLLLATMAMAFGASAVASEYPTTSPAAPSAAKANPKAKATANPNARRTYEAQAEAYWKVVAEKRRLRLHKRRNNLTVTIDDYVLTQPPLYAGPGRMPGQPPDPSRPRFTRMPVMADFLRNGVEQFRFVVQKPESEAAFKESYVRLAAAAGLTQDQIVRIYAFETGGNGTYDVQAGLTTPRSKKARAISPAVGYNQLLNTNTIGLLAAHGEDFIKTLSESTAALNEKDRQALDRKIAAMKRMIEFSRSVPYVWAEHDKIAKTTSGGIGVHALLFDRDMGPLLQVQKLINSVKYARSKGVTRTLTASELEMMNFTGDGNGIDMVTMPQELREKVPTSNFFQRGGYERNPIARRAGTVAGLFAAIDGKMDRASQQDGARELASAFENRKTASGL